MELSFCVVGIDFNSASFHIRSRFMFSASQKIDFSSKLLSIGCAEAVILSTCNRSEVYFLSDKCTPQAVSDALCAFFGAEEFGQYVFSYSGDEALRHLFRVTAGLESAVIGEDQILGQVRDACGDAEAVGSAGKVITKIFRTAVSAAKLIKAETGMSDIPVSASYIGIKKLKTLMGGLAGRSFMLIGTGEMSMLAAKYLSNEDVGKLYICSRSCGKSLPLPENIKYELLPFSERYAYAPLVDAIITATASPHTVLEGAKLKASEKPLYIVDMAVPPDVDAAMYELEDVSVINIDALRTEASENLEKRKALTDAAEVIIDEQLAELKDWLFRRRVDTALESLNRRCDEIAADTESFLENKLEFSPREKKLVFKMVEASLHRLIREPVMRLKALDDEGKQYEYINVVKELFDI